MSALATKSMAYNDQDNSLLADYGTQEFVTVHVADQVLGVGVKEIQDVFAIQHLTPVPGSKREIAGILNLRGRIVTAIDARIRLGLPPRSEGYVGTMAVGVEYKGEAYGILVDRVGEVLRLKDSDFENNPINMDSKWKLISRGIYRLDGRLLMTIDVERLLGILD
jgi:purine-binding chemotaxis protein CheW